MALQVFFERNDYNEPLVIATIKQKEVVRDFVRKAEEKQGRGKYNKYTPEERAAIGKYTAENGPGKACKHFTKALGRSIPESTARKLRAEYLRQLKIEVETEGPSCSPHIKVLPTKRQGRPLLLGEKLDETIRGFIRETRKAGVVPMTMSIVSAKDLSLLHGKGGHLVITSSWAKSLLKRMGYVKRKSSNAGKVALEDFEEFLAEVLMNDIPIDLVFNWDQTGIQLIPTGDWTMHQAKDKLVPITHSDDKRQITGVVAVTATL